MTQLTGMQTRKIKTGFKGTKCHRKQHKALQVLVIIYFSYCLIQPAFSNYEWRTECGDLCKRQHFFHQPSQCFFIKNHRAGVISHTDFCMYSCGCMYIRSKVSESISLETLRTFQDNNSQGAEQN